MKVKRVFSGLEREKEKETSWFIIILITARNIIHGENFKISSFVIQRHEIRNNLTILYTRYDNIKLKITNSNQYILTEGNVEGGEDCISRLA